MIQENMIYNMERIEKTTNNMTGSGMNAAARLAVRVREVVG